MKSKEIKHQLKGLIYLDTINLERKLSSSDELKFFNDDVFVDLSQCRFAELSALTKLLLIIERYFKEQHNVYVALPTVHHTKSEEQSESFNNNEILKESTLKGRQKSNGFLKRCGFVSAMQEIASKYGTNIFITEDYDFDSVGINEESFQDSFSVIFEPYIINDEGYKFLLPFRWIDCTRELNEIIDFTEFEEKTDRILGNHQRGLDGIDVKGIRNVILSELIKNVKEHSGSKYAIFVIGLINSEILFYEHQHKNPNPVEQDYLKWVRENGISAQVEFYFGDSGIGLLNNAYESYTKQAISDQQVSKQRQLEFAFTKWSTLKNNEPRRGTKGLYRLLRIVNKYNGMVHIDTLKSDGGFSLNQSKYRKTEYNFQGTLINVKLNPYKEIKSVKYTLEDKSQAQKWFSRKYTLIEDLTCLEAIKRDIRTSNNLLILLDTGGIDLGIHDNQKLLETLMYEISFEAHPTSVVIYLISDIGNITISTIIDSVQSRILENLGNEIIPEIKNEDFEEIHDPVFVLGNNNEAFWYGGSTELINILQESYELGKIIYDLNSYNELSEEKQSQILLHLKSYDQYVIKLNFKNEIVFNFRDIEKHYEQTIVNALADSPDQRRCSHKLFIVNKWIDIDKMLKKDEFGFALCLYILYRDELERTGGNVKQIDKNNTFILIDHNLQFELAKKFAELLGLKTKNIRNIDSDIDTSIPKRTKLFPKNAKVIFLTTMIASSETVRRLVKYAKRDFATPQIILCLGNFRSYNVDHLETWSETTKILSCYQHNHTGGVKEEKNTDYFQRKYIDLNTPSILINPDLLPDSQNQDNSKKRIEVDKELIEFLKKYKLLHYNHYGLYNKRHFTFFLNKAGILGRDSFLWNKIKESFKDWLNERKIKNYKIYINSSIISENSSFLKMLKDYSNNNVIILNQSIQYINDAHVIYFDFGILTGESINDFISKCTGVDNLFICLLFNQSVNSNKDLFKKIERIKYQKLNGESGSTNFHIEYLYHLPLSFFTSENCPICEHRRALDHYKIDHEYLFKFSEDRQERLKQNSIDDIYEIDYPVDFYYNAGKSGQELSSNIIVQMYELKILLENAKNITKSRIDLFNKIYKLRMNLDVEIQNAESQVYSLLYYLSHEINWFQQEPLIFRDLRVLVSEIALRLAILPINELISYFDVSNKCDVRSDSLATRYKYAAISILRSTDKLVFCQNIYKIISSSIREGKCSNNLLQNTLYHVSSLYKNTYNKSELYYIEIAGNLTKVLTKIKSLTKDISESEVQYSAISNLMIENSKIRRSIITVREEPAKFKDMKDKWEDIYNNHMPAHPEPYQEFTQLILKKYDTFFEDWKIGKLTDQELSILSNRIKQVNASWDNLKNYLENNVIHYFRNYLQSLIESTYFKNHYKIYVDTEQYDTQVNDLDYLIREIDKNWDFYLARRSDYDKILNQFQISYLQKKGLSDFKDDSKLLSLLSDIPSDITRLINETFTDVEFPQKQISLINRQGLLATSEQYNVYFPASSLKMYFNLILENLKKRLNHGINCNDVTIKFNISIEEKDLLQLTILYDSTDEYSKLIKSKGGSLSAFKTLLLEFGGDLKYKLPNPEDENFSIDIKFLRYD